MSLYEFSYLGNHIAKKTNKETILKHETISNDDFGKIYLINNVCCINKKTNKLDFIGDIQEVSNYLAESSKYVCDVINSIENDEIYNIVPQIEGITHKNGVYVGG